MKRIFSLIKATLSEGMNLFRVNTKKKTTFSRVGVPILLTFLLMFLMFSYSIMIMDQLHPVNMDFVLLAMFVFLTSILTIIEGIYKAGNLIFNCKDDNLLLSLPIKRSTVVFIRIFKFYLFELMYNSVFLVPSMIVYAIFVHPSISYYVVSIIAILVFPIVPILISCLLGTVITYLASKFKGKNIAQTIITMIVLLGIMYFSYNSDNLLGNLAQNAASVNSFITKVYFPAGMYIELVTNFNYLILLEFIAIHIVLFALIVLIIGRVYFRINSGFKSVKTRKSNGTYKIKTSTPIGALIKKELKRFVNSTVFITNAGFGLVLFLIGCILLVVKYDGFVESIMVAGPVVSMDLIANYLPIIFFGFLCFTCFMTSITSSMISLEGRTFNILKSLPIKPYKVVQAKVLTALIVMLPCLLVGDLMIFIKFHFDIINIFLLLIASVTLAFVAETMGIIINLRYPKMDATNDTEVVKQSLSSSISVFGGMGAIGLTAFLLYKAVEANLSTHLILLLFTGAYVAIYGALLLVLHKICDKCFENISI